MLINLNRLILLFILCVSLISVVSAQQREQKCSKRHRLNDNAPSVYIEPERDVKLIRLAEDAGRFLLRINNNTCGTIWIDASGGNEKYEDASLYYDVLKNGVLRYKVNCRICSFTGLSRGKTLSFSVPKEHLAKGMSLRIQFMYDWENHDDVFGGREVTHYVQYKHM